MERKNEYILGKARDIVEIGSDWFDRNSNRMLLISIMSYVAHSNKIGVHFEIKEIIIDQFYDNI